MTPQHYAWLLAAMLLTSTIAAQCERGWTVARAADEWTLFTWAEGEPAVWVPTAWAEWAPAVIECESGSRVDAIGDYGRSRGLLQINRAHLGRIEAMGFTWDQMLEGEPNILVAVAIYQEQGWRPWSCARRLGVVE